jgi:hypothetical protein
MKKVAKFGAALVASTVAISLTVAAVPTATAATCAKKTNVTMLGTIKPEIQDAFNERVQKQLQGTVWQAGGCSSWYQSADGRNFSLWPTYTWKYWLETRKVKPKDYLLLNKSSQSYAA